jgi:hypothetical protein
MRKTVLHEDAYITVIAGMTPSGPRDHGHITPGADCGLHSMIRKNPPTAFILHPDIQKPVCKPGLSKLCEEVPGAAGVIYSQQVGCFAAQRDLATLIIRGAPRPLIYPYFPTRKTVRCLLAEGPTGPLTTVLELSLRNCNVVHNSSSTSSTE